MMWRIKVIQIFHVVMNIVGSVANKVEHLISSHPISDRHLVLASPDFDAQLITVNLPGGL